MQTKTTKLTLSGLFLALCLVLPLLTGQIPQIGSALSPMHIPVLLCGFVCGWPYGMAIGFIAPLLRGVIFGMPPIFPVGIAMAFELAAYGALAGLFYKILPKKIPDAGIKKEVPPYNILLPEPEAQVNQRQAGKRNNRYSHIVTRIYNQ